MKGIFLHREWWFVICSIIHIRFIHGLTAAAHNKEIESIYAWWCMFAETSRPDSVICKEWVHRHKTREPRQYIEGHESFHSITETDEMYRAWCKENPLRTVTLCLQYSEEAPASRHSNPTTHPETEIHQNEWSVQGEAILTPSLMTHCPSEENPTVRLVLVVGVEGAGHHLLASILEKATDFVFKKGYSPDIFLTDQHAETNPRIIAQRIRKDKILRPILARAPYSTLRTIAFIEEPFPSGDPKTRSLMSRIDLSAFARLKWHGFSPTLLFLRRHLGMASLSNFKKSPRNKFLSHEMLVTETMAMVIDSYFQHLCRALVKGSRNGTHAAAVAASEVITDPLEESRAMRDGGQGATACYRVDFADLCTGKGKAYMEVAWGMCIPSISKLSVFHKCHNKAKEYSSEEVATVRQFFESPRNRMYLHASDADMLL